MHIGFLYSQVAGASPWIGNFVQQITKNQGHPATVLVHSWVRYIARSFDSLALMCKKNDSTIIVKIIPNSDHEKPDI